MINKKSSIIIYWAPWVYLNKEIHYTFLDLKPKPILTDLRDRKADNPKIPITNNNIASGNYQRCSALHTFAQNMFILKSPFSVSVDLDDTGAIIPSEHSSFFSERISSIDNTFSIDFNIPYLFFSEESIDLTLTPPYMHKTGQTNYGFITAASFNISKWIRCIPSIYQLWEGVKHLQILEDEPISYIKFNTDKKIIFKQFKLTPEIINIVMACQEYKEIKSSQPMYKLYNLFTRTGVRDRTLKAIKENIV